jgi:hypothetical protein
MELQESLTGLHEAMYDPTLLDISRTKKGAFTRKREGGMGFPDALCFMLDMNKTALQSRLNRFYREVKGAKSITEQAFSKLRANFDHTPFEVMTRRLVFKEYSGAYELPTWRGYHLFAVDGSYLQLPWEPELAREFGVRGGGKRPSAGISVLFDLLHGWILDAEIDRTDRSERHALERHIEFLAGELPHIAAQALLLADRGYPSYDLLRKCEENGLKYVMRCPLQSLKGINEAPMGDSTVALESGQQLRVVKFLLKSGEVEILATNLFDLPESAFPALYAMRWGVETYYHKLKQIVGVEQFSGKTPNSVRQDFWASMVLLINTAIAQQEADREVAGRHKAKNNKHSYRAATTKIVVALRDRLVFATLCGYPDLAAIALEDILDELSRAVSPLRPGRSYPRKPRLYAAANLNLKSRL